MKISQITSVLHGKEVSFLHVVAVDSVLSLTGPLQHLCDVLSINTFSWDLLHNIGSALPPPPLRQRCGHLEAFFRKASKGHNVNEKASRIAASLTKRPQEDLKNITMSMKRRHEGLKKDALSMKRPLLEASS